MLRPELLCIQNERVDDVTVENTVSSRTVSIENVSKSDVDVLKSSSSVHEQNTLNTPTMSNKYINIDFINKTTHKFNIYCANAPNIFKTRQKQRYRQGMTDKNRTARIPSKSVQKHESARTVFKQGFFAFKRRLLCTPNKTSLQTKEALFENHTNTALNPTGPPPRNMKYAHHPTCTYTHPPATSRKKLAQCNNIIRWE